MLYENLGCFDLESVILESGSQLENIDDDVFYSCGPLLMTVYNPYNGSVKLEYIDWGTKVEIEYVEPEEPDTPINGTCGDDLTWAYENGVLTIEGTGEMVNYNDGDNAPAWSKRKDYITSIVVNSGVTKIGDYAFALCKNVPTITLPSTLEWIGKNAFMNCTNLETVTLHSLPYFDYYNNDIFGGCSSDLAITLELIDSDYPYYHLSDSSDEMPPFAAISYKRTLANGTVGTIMLPFDPEPIEGVIFRAPEEITTDDVTEATQLVFNKVADDEVWGFKPYLVENNSGNDEIVFTPRQSTGEILYPKNTSDHMDANNTWMQLSSYWHFEGTYELQELDYQNYSVDEEGKPIVDLYYYSTELEKFVYSEGTLIIPPFRAYIKHNSIVEAGDRHDIVIIFSDGDDETTIGGVLTDEGDIDAAEGIYDLSGRRIDEPQHGQTYIIRTQSGKAIKYMNK